MTTTPRKVTANRNSNRCRYALNTPNIPNKIKDTLEMVFQNLQEKHTPHADVHGKHIRNNMTNPAAAKGENLFLLGYVRGDSVIGFAPVNR